MKRSYIQYGQLFGIFNLSLSSASNTLIQKEHRQRNLQTLGGPSVSYTLTSDVSNELKIDLDLVSIYTKTLAGESNTKGLDVYTNGDESTVTFESMGTSSDTMFPNKYYAFSGVYNYGDEVMKAALNGVKTEFSYDFTNFDLSVFGYEGRAEFFRYTALGSVYNQIHTELIAASEKCSNDTSIALEHLDKAVAFYTGSMHTNDAPWKQGLFYNLAETESRLSGTYHDKKGTSEVNINVFTRFNLGKSYLNEERCNLFAGIADMVGSLMLVPLFQALLRHTYALDSHADSSEKTQGEAAGLAASVLPFLRFYDESAAVVVYKDLSPGKATSASFEVIKYQLERTYKHLGISCSEVGGVLNFSGGYWKNAEPCDYVAPSEPTSPPPNNEKNDSPLIVGVVFGVVGALMAGAFAASKFRNIEKEKVLETSGDLNLEETQNKQIDAEVI